VITAAYFLLAIGWIAKGRRRGRLPDICCADGRTGEGDVVSTAQSARMRDASRVPYRADEIDERYGRW
jgi:hypothetical protein